MRVLFYFFLEPDDTSLIVKTIGFVHRKCQLKIGF